MTKVVTYSPLGNPTHSSLQKFAGGSLSQRLVDIVWKISCCTISRSDAVHSSSLMGINMARTVVSALLTVAIIAIIISIIKVRVALLVSLLIFIIIGKNDYKGIWW